MTRFVTILAILLLTLLVFVLLTQNQTRHSKGVSASCQPKGRKLAPLMEPEFNIREVTKNMILLEDHLFHDDRRCPDCVRKHCLTIEAFLDEAFSLDKSGKYTPILKQVSMDFRDISTSILKCCDEGLKDTECSQLGQRVRDVRKKLMPLVQ